MTNEGERFPFSVSELCFILKACGKAQVSELKFGPLEVRFSPDRTLADQKIASPSIPTAEIVENQKIEAEKSAIAREIELRELELEELILTNPSLAEQLIAEGDLVDGHHETDEGAFASGPGSDIS